MQCPQCGAEQTVPEQDTAAPPRAARMSFSTAADADEGDGGFRVRRVVTTFEDMDLTPMVDVVFQLLIFFMLTASFSLARGVEVPASEQPQKGARQSVPRDELELRSIMVTIDERNAIFVDDEPLRDPARLEDLLRDQMRAERKNELVIEADDRASLGTVVAVKDAATGAGVERIRLARIREGGRR